MRSQIAASTVALLALCYGPLSPPAAAAETSEKEILTFNEQLRNSILSMDNAAAMALWADDGVTLLPGMAPISGKPTIAKWLDDVVAQMPGYKVTRQDDEFHDLRVSGDWASEWGTTHQVVQPPGGKPPLEIYGKILLVLHRDKDGHWKIKEEMWNNGEAPTAKK